MKQDLQGRIFIAHHDVRGAIVTASASVSTGTITSLKSGDSDYFLDIIEMSFSNNSDAAVTVVLSSDGTTLRTLQVAANATVQQTFDTPLAQLTKNTPWLVDLPDITGTTVTVEARLIKK